MREIRLTKGKVALVDDSDYEWITQWSWYASEGTSGIWYAVRCAVNPLGGTTTYRMHRIILNAKLGVNVDHRDGNGLNNTRTNIRLCTISENLRNQRKTRGTSTYKGVAWDKPLGKWRSQIFVGGKTITIGRFPDEVEAAKAYDAVAIKEFGDFARPNFVGVLHEC